MTHRKIQFKNPIILALLSLLGIGLLLLIGPVFSVQSDQPTTDFEAVFEEVWETVNENFYDPNFNGVDWTAERKKYAPQAARAQSTEEMAQVINQMLSELQTSHTHFYTQIEPAYYQLLGIFAPGSELEKDLAESLPEGRIDYPGIGIFTQDIDGKTFIKGILDGGPAAASELQVGDQLLNVDGAPYEPIRSFRDKVDQEVTLWIQPTSSTDSQVAIAVAPTLLDPAKMFLDAEKASVEVIEQQDAKIGYIHIWSYAGDQYQKLLEEELTFGRLKDADGLVLDLRDGWGGANPSYLNIFTAQGPNLAFVRRNGEKTTWTYQWRKPVAMLVNEGSRSGKEILAFGFQQYEIGPVVGSQTAGAVVGGSAFLMQDGSLLYLAVVDAFIDGERLEGKGIIPDIPAPFSLEYAQGEDPQKKRAIEVVQAALS